MGCKQCKDPDTAGPYILREILKSIELDSPQLLFKNLKRFSMVKNKPISSFINLRLIQVQSKSLTILSYTLSVGAVKSFKYLSKTCGASIEESIKNFSDYGLNPLSFICEKNHLSMVKYFLPIYFKSQLVKTLSFESTDLEKIKINSPPRVNLSPVQVACLFANLTLINFLVEYNLSFPDKSLDIHEINEETGENCALISIRSGSLAMVKMMFEVFQGNFFIKNIFDENALQICAVCSNKAENQEYFDEIFMYLLVVVGLDPCENYEETLIILEKKNLIEFYEELLESRGIKAKKREIDKMYRVRANVDWAEQFRGKDLSEISSIKGGSSEIEEDSFEE